jgi:hypothetical protein
MPPRASWDLDEKEFGGLPARADRLLIFTLHRKDRLSVAGRLGLGLKQVIYTVGK